MAKFKNLEEEMVRNGLQYKNIAEKLGVSLNTARRKLSGDIGITLTEAKKIQSLFNTDFTIDFLFAE